MGAVFSTSNPRNSVEERGDMPQGAACKRQKLSSSFSDELERLIPSLPDELSMQILARIPRIRYLSLKLVSKRWMAAIMDHELYKTRKELQTSEEWLYLLTRSQGNNELLWYALDPTSKSWQKLPPMPKLSSLEDARRPLWNMAILAETIKQWLGKRHSPDKQPFCGSAIGAAEGCLYVIGGFFNQSTMNCAWKFDPIQNKWSKTVPMLTGRAYCKTELLNNKLYVVGGVSQTREGLTTLQSAEVFDPSTTSWSPVPNMPFSRAQMMPTAFLNVMLKPLATGMASYKGKLHVPQSLYVWPFIVDAGGEVYNPETDSWEEMPAGMAEGWPARKAGTKLSVVVDGKLYAFDPSSSRESGKVMVYDAGDDAWKVATEKVPVCDFAADECPYLLAGFHRRIHVVTKDERSRTVVMQADPTEASGWKAVACRHFGSSELVSCQVLDV